ncbi:hypothetical protein L1987_33837 [Smallanthus sonchifolius]|uniref:Uncharacterized protein n=1 Tax=Smallanthus sonchifolius TaxID=185202 RepID=A0ACB9HTV7_9ASTR|nr:hypothetical protein L1987_33837 [Smallanthus sonchifolius]
MGQNRNQGLDMNKTGNKNRDSNLKLISNITRSVIKSQNCKWVTLAELDRNIEQNNEPRQWCLWSKKQENLKFETGKLSAAAQPRTAIRSAMVGERWYQTGTDRSGDGSRIVNSGGLGQKTSGSHDDSGSQHADFVGMRQLSGGGPCGEVGLKRKQYSQNPTENWWVKWAAAAVWQCVDLR